MSPKNSLKGIVLILIASLAFASMGACVKAVSKAHTTMEVVWFRAVVGLLLLIPWMIWRKIPFRGRHPFFLSLRAFSGFLALVCYFYTLRHLNLATAVVLNYTAPVFVMLLAVPFLKEKISLGTFFLFFISFAGVFCLGQMDFRIQLLPFMTGLTSAFFAAVAYVTISYLGRFESPFTVIFHFSFWSVILSTPHFLLHAQKPQGINWVFLVGAGIFAAIGQWGMTKAYFHGPASIISITSSATPLISYLLGVLFWGESLPFVANIGIFMIIFGSVLLSIRYQRSRGV